MIGAVFDRPLSRSDVVGSYAGLRPLLRAEGRSADLSRQHAVLTSRDGIVTVVGGKLTTYPLDVDDLLDRRTRIGLVPADRAAARSAAEAALALSRH